MCRLASMKAGYASTIVGSAVQSTSAALVSSSAADRARANAAAFIRRRDARSVSCQRARLMPSSDRRRTACCSASADDRDVEALRQQIAALLVQLPQQRAADVADADRPPAPAAGASRRTPGGSTFSARTCCVGVDHARDVALRRALGDRADVDVVPAERAEHLPGDAGPPLHPLADHRDDRLVGARRSSRVSCSLQLEPELLLDRRRPPRAASALRTAKQIVCSDEACEIRMTLTPPRRQRPEQPLGDAGHADHARARAASAARGRRPSVIPLATSCPSSAALARNAACPARPG